MADRIHPRESPTLSGEAPTVSSGDCPKVQSKLSQSMPEKPVPSSGTYVIQVPKDQIYRYPPPENARRYQKYVRPKPRRSYCCRCLFWTLGLLVLQLLLVSVTAGVLYLVFRPESPKYSIADVVIRGFNTTSLSDVSPEFDVTITAQNPNDKIGIYYEKGSSVTVYYSDIKLANGALPMFYQPSNNLTIFQTALKGSNILLTAADQSALEAEQKQGHVPFRFNLRAPVKIKLGAVKTWTITVRVKCDVTVDSPTTSSKIVSKDCKYNVKLW